MDTHELAKRFLAGVIVSRNCGLDLKVPAALALLEHHAICLPSETPLTPNTPSSPEGDQKGPKPPEDLSDQETELCRRIEETTGRAPVCGWDGNRATVEYCYLDGDGNWRARTVENGVSNKMDRMKHALRTALRAAKLDHVPNGG